MITPRPAKDMPPDMALASPPSLDLDIFVYHNILEAPDVDAIALSGTLPGFSRVYGSSAILLIKCINEIGPISVAFGPHFFEEAIRRGFVVRKRPCLIWRIVAGSRVGMGRNFEEALCKILIAHKYNLGGEAGK